MQEILFVGSRYMSKGARSQATKESVELKKDKLYKGKRNYLSMMKLTKEDKELIEKARVLVGTKKVSGGVVKEVG